VEPANTSITKESGFKVATSVRQKRTRSLALLRGCHGRFFFLFFSRPYPKTRSSFEPPYPTLTELRPIIRPKSKGAENPGWFASPKPSAGPWLPTAVRKDPCPTSPLSLDILPSGVSSPKPTSDPS
jgi:hypothetical protein